MVGLAQESRQIEAIAKIPLMQVALTVTVNNNSLLFTTIITVIVATIYTEPGTFPSTSNMSAHLILRATLEKELLL